MKPNPLAALLAAFGVATPADFGIRLGAGRRGRRRSAAYRRHRAEALYARDHRKPRPKLTPAGLARVYAAAERRGQEARDAKALDKKLRRLKAQGRFPYPASKIPVVR